ncbi:hypothetical protein, partial [Hornefia butyriciproducens]|uniref:hypothetical protein n=1 Tax=Hornefia butyriciproducens TaxID=2652293 RepID=UPI0023F1C6DB
SFCHAMNPYWLIEFYSISGLIPIPDFMKPASAGRFSLKCGSYLFIQALPQKNYKIQMAVFRPGRPTLTKIIEKNCYK